MVHTQGLDGLAQLLGARHGACARTVAQQQCKFIPAQSGRSVATPHLFMQQIGHLLQHAVACGMAGVVVDTLEAVQIQKHQRGRRAGRLGLQCARQPVVKGAAVEQARQRVVLG